ncbi:MAG: NrfD/PsrC family molybdoenzyme membrane anchor subunit, partial [Terriglobia bacterium]
MSGSPGGTDEKYEGIDYQKVNRDMIGTLTRITWKYYLMVGLIAAYFVYAMSVWWLAQTRIGVGVTGGNNHIFWITYIITFVFWIGLSHAGTFLSAILHLLRADWRKPIYRIAEVMTSFALFTTFLVLTLHLGRPWRGYFGLPFPVWREIWANFRSPLGWDLIAISAYFTSSVLFLYVGTVPDIAVARDHMKGWRVKLYKVLSLGWRGTAREWKALSRTYLIMASLITPLMISVHSVVSWDFAAGITPGFHTTVLAPFFVEGALFSGIAGVITLAILVRRFLNMEEYIQMGHMDKLGKFLLVLSLFWTYFHIVEVAGVFYSQNTNEIMTYMSKLYGTFAPTYWLMIATLTFAPLLLFFPKVRTNIPAMFIIAALVNVGMWFERFNIIIPGLGTGHLPFVWASYAPSWQEVSIILGTFAWFSLLFSIFLSALGMYLLVVS